MSFENTARKVVEAVEAANSNGEPIPVSVQEELFFRGLKAEGYGTGLDFLAQKAKHTVTCKKMHAIDLETSDGLLGRDILKLVSYGYMKDLMQRRFGLALAYPARDTLVFAGQGTPLEIPAFAGDVEAELNANPLARDHLLAQAEAVKASGVQLVHAVSPKTEVAAQLLNLLAGESLRAAVIGWLSARIGMPLDGNWYGCCAPAIAPKGKLSLTFEEQLKYQTDPTVMC